MRRIGFLLSGMPPDDPEGQRRIMAFLEALQELDWTEGRDVGIDYRWGLGEADRLSRYAAEFVALAQDVILAVGNPAVAALQQATRTLPIVFTNVTDPIGAGYVSSILRPGGNATGFINIEFGLSRKWLELLKQIAPHVTRAAVFRNAAGTNQFVAIQAIAPSLGMELYPVDSTEIERALTSFSREANVGLIVVASELTQFQRDLIIALAARHRLPAVYPSRSYVAEGGLLSYGPDDTHLYGCAASYVDRILKGESPANLPVQTPARQTVLNLKTAKSLGLDVPATVLARADEIIE